MGKINIWVLYCLYCLYSFCRIVIKHNNILSFFYSRLYSNNQIASVEAYKTVIEFNDSCSFLLFLCIAFLNLLILLYDEFLSCFMLCYRTMWNMSSWREDSYIWYCGDLADITRSCSDNNQCHFLTNSILSIS